MSNTTCFRTYIIRISTQLEKKCDLANLGSYRDGETFTLIRNKIHFANVTKAKSLCGHSKVSIVDKIWDKRSSEFGTTSVLTHHHGEIQDKFHNTVLATVLDR